MAELTNYEVFQLERYGDILPGLSVMPDGTCENNEEEIERSARWVEQQAEQQLIEQQNNEL